MIASPSPVSVELSCGLAALFADTGAARPPVMRNTPSATPSTSLGPPSVSVSSRQPLPARSPAAYPGLDGGGHAPLPPGAERTRLLGSTTAVCHWPCAYLRSTAPVDSALASGTTIFACPPGTSRVI